VQNVQILTTHDKFVFDVDIPLTAQCTECIEFCVGCIFGAEQGSSWDNNDGRNYRLENNAVAQTMHRQNMRSLRFV
jgi:hypothetical protein